jgi:hypothetical protein
MIGGRASRDKGNRAEREMVRLLRAVGFSAKKVSRAGYAGSDLSIRLLGRNRRAEVKARRAGFKQFYNWLSDRDLLIVRADHREPLIITPFRLAMQIARAAQNSRLRGSAPAPSGNPPQQKVETMSEEPKNENLPVITLGADGFDDVDPNERLIQGPIARCVDGHWTWRDGTAIPPETRWLALATVTALQHWENQLPVETIIKRGGTPLPDLDELNAKIPKDQWELLDGKPRPPWVRQHGAYLLNPVDGSVCTFINSTVGAARAVSDLKDRVRWMRALRGRAVVPLVRPGSRPMPTKHGVKQRPEFVIVEWRDLGSLQAAPTTVPALGKPVEPPSLKEEMGDEIPFNDPVPDLGKAESPKAPAPPLPTPRRDLKKPAAKRRPANPLQAG